MRTKNDQRRILLALLAGILLLSINCRQVHGADSPEVAIRQLERKSDEDIHKGNKDAALVKLKWAIQMAKESKLETLALHLRLKSAQLRVTSADDKIWTQCVKEIIAEKDQISRAVKQDPEIGVDLDDLYDSIRMRASKQGSTQSIASMQSFIETFHLAKSNKQDLAQAKADYFEKKDFGTTTSLLASG